MMMDHISRTNLNVDDFFTSLLRKKQVACEDFHSQHKDMLRFDPAIISIGRLIDAYNITDDNSSCQTIDQSGSNSNDQQQINIVDQMIIQPRLPYALLPKHFKPKQILKGPAIVNINYEKA